MKAILRFEKMKTLGNVSGMEKHVERKMEVPNADITKSKHNVSFIKGSAVVNLKNRLDEIKENGGIVQKNSVVAIDCLMTASPEFWNKRGVEKKFIHKAHQYLSETFGSENIMSMVVHKDETSPHIHAIVCPAYESKDRWGNKRIRVGAKKWLDGRQKLSEQQDRFAEIMAPLGLERGEKKSKAKHKTIQKFYAEIEQNEKSFKAILRDFPKKRLTDSHESYLKSVEAHLMQFSDMKKMLLDKEFDKKKLVDQVLENVNKASKHLRKDLKFNYENGNLIAIQPSVMKEKQRDEDRKMAETKRRHKEQHKDHIFKELFSSKQAKDIDWNFIKSSFDRLDYEDKVFVVRNVIKDDEYIDNNKKIAFYIKTETQELKKDIEARLKSQEPKSTFTRDFSKSNNRDNDFDFGR